MSTRPMILHECAHGHLHATGHQAALCDVTTTPAHRSSRTLEEDYQILLDNWKGAEGLLALEQEKVRDMVAWRERAVDVIDNYTQHDVTGRCLACGRAGYHMDAPDCPIVALLTGAA